MMNMMETARVDAIAAPLDEKLMQRIKADEVLLGIKDPKSSKSFENYQKPFIKPGAGLPSYLHPRHAATSSGNSARATAM